MLYVLRLAGGNYYVGFTEQPVARRVAQHRRGGGSAWTSKHGVEELIETRPGDRVDEDGLTLRYMYEYGIERVRGGPYVHVVLSASELVAIQQRFRMAFPACGLCYGPHPSRFCRVVIDGQIGAVEARRLAGAAAAFPDLAAAVADRTGDVARFLVHYGILAPPAALLRALWPDRIRAAFVNLQDAACYDDLPELLDDRARVAADGSIARYRAMRGVLDAIGWSLFDDLPPVPSKRLHAILATCFRDDATPGIERANGILRPYCCQIAVVRGVRPQTYTLRHEAYGTLFRLLHGRIVVADSSPDEAKKISDAANQGCAGAANVRK